MRSLVCIAILIVFTPVAAFAKTEATSETQVISDLVQRAQQAHPKDQCYLYAMILQSMTELADHQLMQGNEAGADTTLQKMQRYALLLHESLQPRTKKLKNSEELLHSTSLRLQGLMHNAPFNDQSVVKATLTNVEHVESELLNQVFLH
ncbi:MAG TPA: hypothetical protein VHX63_02340 [Acidobacteriaceae bacterium]|jgi:hypothetical protein|nr:hypothetical protein [Acidobacteriaceae bacterium]